MSAFAQATREATFSPTDNINLVEGTVNATLSYVAQAFRSNNRPDPRLDVDGKIYFMLQEQFRGYRNQDGSRRKQKALPMSVLRKMHEIADSPKDKALTWLLIGAIFFAMRSCEYLATAAEESKRTKVLRLRNISFKRGNKQLKHGSKVLHLADLVQIRFEFQKNDHRDVIIHMFRSGDSILCPVIAWANTIRRVRLIPGSSEGLKVCLFRDNKENISLISSNYVRSRLRAVVTLLGEMELGFNKDDIGLHSIWSGGAMPMFLLGTSVIIIQRVV